MTTQRTNRALAREAAGLCLTALGVLGVLVALGALHWAAALNAAMTGLIIAGRLTVPKPSAPRRAHVLRWAVCGVGYIGATACAFVLCAPIGWLYIAVAAIAAGLWLATRESEGA
ncbi:hypothetical protein GCM10010261_63840 [Streptomyces pilosus]|uniref:hypothetical protein n=1 Tax=Streptomyces pilosus TaxID=28893 RepID=UPI00167BBF39|nr:hypothetical protein [Streptomyces pilosus]GGV69341.1 hypothetical protein GCM10010261_63840 [Streptomyces pilosus]